MFNPETGAILNHVLQVKRCLLGVFLNNTLDIGPHSYSLLLDLTLQCHVVVCSTFPAHPESPSLETDRLRNLAALSGCCVS